MSTFFLRLEAVAGTLIDDAAVQAIQIANQLQLTVMFDFNGVSCMACPGDNAKSLASEAMRILNIERKQDSHKPIARGR